MSLIEARWIAHIVREAYEQGEIRTLADCKFIFDTMGITEILSEWIGAVEDKS
jgi:hypothetical protein